MRNITKDTCHTCGEVEDTHTFFRLGDETVNTCIPCTESLLENEKLWPPMEYDSDGFPLKYGIFGSAAIRRALQEMEILPR